MALLLVVWLGLPARAGVASAAEPAWPAGPAPGRPVRVLSTPNGVIAATDSGVYRLEAAGWSRAFARGPVRDVARAGDALLVATASGLYALPDGSAAPRPLALGAGARVTSLAVDATGRQWVGTEVGLFARGPDEALFRRAAGLPAGRVHAVRSSGAEVFVARRGSLWQRGTAGRWRERLRGLDDGWWELRAARRAGAALLLGVPRGVWRLGRDGDRAHALGVGALRGLEVAGDTAWVATARGLFAFPLARLEGAAPVLRVRAETFDVARDGGRLWVATDRGIAVVAAAEPTAAPATARAWSGARAAELRALHRAVLAEQGLEPRRLARAEARARGAALLPEVRVRVSVDRDRDRDRDLDQTFTSGALRELYDRGRGHGRGLELSLELTWSLDEHLEPAHAIAVSRERRELVELRDQVLERVNRLYFERLRARAELGALAPDAGAARAALELRVHELGAGLEAWTGGRFGALTSDSPRVPLENAP